MTSPAHDDPYGWIREREQESWGRFLDSVGPWARKDIEDSEKLRHEFIRHV